MAIIQGGEMMEILPGVYQVPGVQGNCYLLERGGLILIDSGLPWNSKKIVSYIRDTLGRDPLDLRYVILTHYHADHTGNATDLKEITGAKVAIHEEDADYLAGKKPIPHLKSLRGRLITLVSYLWPISSVSPNLLLYDRDKIYRLECIHTPGNTSGSISLYDPELRLLFSGDAVITRNGMVNGPPSWAIPDMDQAMQSVEKISRYDYEYLLPGHGMPITQQGTQKMQEFHRRWSEVNS